MIVLLVYVGQQPENLRGTTGEGDVDASRRRAACKPACSETYKPLLDGLLTKHRILRSVGRVDNLEHEFSATLDICLFRLDQLARRLRQSIWENRVNLFKKDHIV